ncbi:MAG: glycosyltransferase family 4 protein [Weeksellaceae bacterium]|nr:glycosyltransferase family 4 protein [Weeksellaceae bacterium]
MGLSKKIKKYFVRQDKLRLLKTCTVLNVDLYNPSKKTILFASQEFPKHDKDSGSNRLKEIILIYKKLDYNCILYAPDAFEDDVYVHFYRNLGVIIFVENLKFRSILDILPLVKIDFIWFNGPLALRALYKKLKNKVPQAKFLYDMVDLHFLRYQRALEIEPTRISLKKKYKRFLYLETVVAPKLDLIIAISEKEKDMMSEFVDQSKIISISNIHFPKIDPWERKNFEDSRGIIFIGSVHEPNVDAVDFLYKKIMPIVWEKNPEILVYIIGSVSEKFDQKDYPKFHFLGFVENVESLFKNAKMMVAPLRFGAGVKGKIGQALEYFLPIVTTEIGAEGMHLVDGQNAIIKNDEKDFAAAILQLNSDIRLWNTLSENSVDSLKPFSTEMFLSKLANI